MVNLDTPSQANVTFMVDAIKTKLKMATAAAMQPEHFDLERYEDIKEIYDIIAGKSNFSISEVEALVSELGQLRK